MPYYKSRSRRPRMYRRKRRYRRRRPMTSGKVKRIIGAELKKTELSAGPISIPFGTGSVINLSTIDLGEAFNQRNGNWVKPIVLQGYITLRGNSDQFATDSSVTVRVAILRWNNDLEFESPSITNVMSDVSAPMCPFKLRSKGSFKILWTRVCLLSNNDDNSESLKLLKFRVKLSGAPRMTYDGLTQKKYSYHILAYSEVDVAEDPPTYEFCSNLRYTDS